MKLVRLGSTPLIEDADMGILLKLTEHSRATIPLQSGRNVLWYGLGMVRGT